MIDDKGRMHGGDAGLAHLFHLRFLSGKEVKYVFKCSGADENAFREWNKFREAMFYDQWMPDVRKRVEEATDGQSFINIPMSLFSVVDPPAGRYIICMEYFENIIPLDEVLREGNPNRFKEMTGTGPSDDNN